MPQVDNCLRALEQLLLPPACTLCGATRQVHTGLCPGCRADLPWLGPACGRCALPLPTGPAICGPCAARPPPTNAALAALRYAEPVSGLLRGLKFHGQLHHATLLSAVALPVFAAAPRPDLLVPVPLHVARLRQRGYDQALELARPVARELGLTLERDLCRRIRPTGEQTRLDAAARRRNLRGAFAVSDALDGVHVAILDDVVTTGATIRELAKCLRAAGATTIQAWSIARA